MSKDRGGDVTATNSADRKNNGGGGGAGGAGGGGNDPQGMNQLLDAASLFAYWGGQNPQAAAAAAGGGNALFGNPFANAGLGAMLGGAGGGGGAGGAGNPGGAAGAAGAAGDWWMAQLAAQDYFSRLQASGFGQMPFSQSDFPPGLAASMGMPPMNGSGPSASSGGGGGQSSRGGGGGGGNESKGNSRSKKERKNNNNSGGTNNSAANSYQQSAAMYNHAANLQLAMQAAAAMAQGMPSGNASGGGFHQSGGGGGSSSKKQSSSSNKSSSSSAAAAAAAYANQMSSHHHQQQQPERERERGKGSDRGGGGGGGSNYKESGRSSASTGGYGNSATAAQLSMNAMLAANPQFASLSSLQSQLNAAADMSAALLAAQGGGGGGGKSSGGGGMHNAALEGSDPSSLLGVRLPPDTEIIKYTSSMVGPKVPGSAQHNANGRGATSGSSASSGGRGDGLGGATGDSSADAISAKRSRLDPDYSSHQNNDRVEVIKLPSNGIYNLSTKSSAKETGGGGGNKDNNEWLNLSTKSNHSGATGSFGAGDEGDAPLNLSLKSGGDVKLGSASPGNSLQSLSSITAALGGSSSGGGGGGGGSGGKSSDRSARRRGVGGAAAAGSQQPQQQQQQLQHQQQALRNQESTESYFSNLLRKATAPISSTDEDFDFESPFMQYKEGRPRNLGRGVSKPKKNTVASLLAQSRAVGSKPMLNPSDMDYEKLKQMLAEASQSVDMSTDSESVAAESGVSESESDAGEPANVQELRAPLERGWRRETIIKGLTKNGQIRGDVYYMGPNSQTKIKNFTQLEPVLSKQGGELTRDNFSFSARPLVGMFLQAPPFPPDADYIRMTDEDVAKRLEELKMFTRHSQLDVEQRIEIAKQQQAMREAKKLAKDEVAKNKEKAKLAKELEKNERLEAQRKEREIKTQQAMEARRKKQEEMEKLKMEEMQRKQQEKELKKQRAILQKEQELNKQKEMLYAIELERERRRQHMNYTKQLDLRRRFDEREKKKHQMALDKLIARERRLAHRNRNSELLTELRKPHEDMSILQDEKEVQGDFPVLQRVPNMKLTGQAFADLLMVFEFLHNFGETLGFDMDSLPTLDSLHQALVAENALEAEEELLSVMTHLLVCAIEDPGVPNPARHTTLLGQSLRQADLTNANISEVLRIYLYAIATGEVRQMTRIGFERERERRVADHHQAEITDFAGSKNSQYYELLHENMTWKLSEQLRDKPFVSLSPPLKAQILAHLCNDLLMNKAVLKQIETSLESANQMRKDRYLMDAKIRKCRSTHQRKVRMNQFLAEAERFERARLADLAAKKKEEEEEKEKLALANGAVAAEEGEKTGDEDGRNGSERDESASKLTDPSTDEADKESAPASEATTNGGEGEKPQVQADSEAQKPAAEKESTPEATTTTTTTKKENGNKTVPEIEEELSDMDGGEDLLHNLDVEDEDERLSVDELAKKLDKLEKQAAHNQEVFETSIKQLRGQHVGQDRFWRRYWNLPKAGGIFVEGLESAQGEILGYHEVMEQESLRRKAEEPPEEEEEPAVAESSEEGDEDEEEDGDNDVEMKEDDDGESAQTPEESAAAPSDSESGIEEGEGQKEKDGFEAEVKADPLVNGGESTEAREIAHQLAMKPEPEQMDIEDSIPRLLVQKSNGCSEEAPQTDLVKTEKMELDDEEVKLAKAESDGIDCETKKKKEEPTEDQQPMEVQRPEPTIKPEIVIVEDSEDNDIKKEATEEEDEEKWFSLVSREIPLDSQECPASYATQVLYNNISCETIVQMQGHRWDIVNNLQYYNTNTLELPSASEFAMATETILTPSGLSEALMCKVLKSEDLRATLQEIKEETDAHQGDCKAKSMIVKQSAEDLVQHGFTIPPFLSITLPNISNYLQCDNSVPVSMSEEEEKMLEVIKKHGWPKRNLLNFVPKQLRHGWWKVNDKDLAETLADVLLLRGVREKSLRTNLLNALTEEVDFSQSCPLGPLDASETIADVEFVEPGSVAAFNPRIIERVEMALLEQIESLEDKISSASMQIKGWSAPSRDAEGNANASAGAGNGGADGGVGEEGEKTAPVPVPVDHSIGMMRERILDLEAAIERRYLKPPLGNNVGEVNLAMLAQNQDGTTASASGTNTPAVGVNAQNTATGGASMSGIGGSGGGGGGGQSGVGQTSGPQVPSSQQSNHSDQTEEGSEPENISKGLVSWRDAVSRSVTTAQLSMALYVLESCVAWDKSIMKAPVLQILKQMKAAKKTSKKKKSGSQTDRLLQNCQFCHSGENEDKLLLCDSCDKGYHTYCFKPRMEKIPEGDWYCFECVNKATGERKCIVCGGLRPAPVGKMLLCELCPRAYHHDCMIPPLIKVPRGKWYCHGCVSKAPPPKKRVRKSKDQQSQPQTPATPNQATASATASASVPVQCNTPQTPRSVNQNSMSHDDVPLSPAYSVASTSFDDNASNMQSTNQSMYTSPNHHHDSSAAMNSAPSGGFLSQQQQHQTQPPQQVTSNGVASTLPSGATPAGSRSNSNTRASSPTTSCDMHDSSLDGMNSASSVVTSMNEVRDKLKGDNKKDKQTTKKLIKEMAPCKTMMQEMEVHEEAWPFLLPVNTKQFPTYKKIIKSPMDLSTIQKRVHDLSYKNRDEFIQDVRQIFDNCEVFNEDDSPVGKAGHNMRKFFEMRWSELTEKGS